MSLQNGYFTGFDESTAVIINGTAYPIRQEIAHDFDPENGYVFRQRFAGAGYAEMVQLANRFAFNGVKYSFTFENGLAHLHTTDTSSQITIDTWTIAQDKLQKSALENPLIKAAFFQSFLIQCAKVQTGEAEYDTVNALIDSSLSDADLKAKAHRLLDAIKLGSTDYASSGYVLRHTTNVGNRYEANISDANIDALYDISFLLSETRDPNLWIFPMSGRLAYKLQFQVADFISRYGTHDGFLWSFLKLGSTESSAANNRINITTEYSLDEWSTDRYAIAI